MNYYKIHKFLCFSIENINENWLNEALYSIIIKDYKNFQSTNPIADLNFKIGNFKPELTGCYALDGKSYVKENYLFSTKYYKFARYMFDISGWEENRFIARIECNTPGYWMLRGLIIDPLVLYSLVQRKVFPIHASCIANEDGAYLFAGSSGTGKTSICLNMLNYGYSLLGDNYVLLAKGHVYSFLSPLNIFSYNLTDRVKRRISWEKLIALRLKHFLWKSTRGYIKIFTKINPVDLWPHHTNCEDSIPRAFCFMLKSNRFHVGSISKEDLTKALVKNMKLEISVVLEWLALYTFVNPEFAFQEWIDQYGMNLIDNLANIEHLFLVEIPDKIDNNVTDNMQRVIDGLKG